MPGEYTVRLTVDGVTHEETLTVKMDPRVETGLGALRTQFEWSMWIRDAMAAREAALERLRSSGTEAPERLVAVGGELETLYRILQGSDGSPMPRIPLLAQELTEEVAGLVRR